MGDVMNNLKKIRQSNNLSQSAFAKIIGVAQNTVSNWENGNRLIDNETLKKISSLFNVSIDYLLGQELKKEKPVENDELKEKNVKFIGRDGSVKFKKLSPEMIAMLEQLPDSGDDL